MITSFDPQCWSLAEHFLQDEPCCQDPELYQLYCHELALTIQAAIENWMFVQIESGAVLQIEGKP
jgi:hypothetical protein